MISNTVRYGARQQRVRCFGDSGPAIFLIHGFSDSSRSWIRLARDLEDAFKVFAPDMFGHGESSPLNGLTSVSSFADDVARLMDYCGVESAAVCGHSMGGVIAGQVAASHPDRVSAIILEDPAWRLEAATIPQYVGQSEQGQEWHRWLVALREMGAEKAMASIMPDTADWDLFDRQMYLEDRLTCDLNIFSQLDFSSRNSWRSDLEQNKAPLLLVTGSIAGGGIIDGALADEIFRLNGGGERLHVEAAGHGIHREQYESFYAGVRDFLQRHLLLA